MLDSHAERYTPGENNLLFCDFVAPSVGLKALCKCAG